MNKAKTLKTLHNLSPSKLLDSPSGRLKIALFQALTHLLPGRFAVWLSLLEDGRLERRVRFKFGLRSLVPGDRHYRVPRFHIIVERNDWLAVQEMVLGMVDGLPDSPPLPPKQSTSSITLKPLFEMLRRIGSDLTGVHGRVRVSFLLPDRTHTLIIAINNEKLNPNGSFFDVGIPQEVVKRILTGELDLSSALLRGHIQVGGDTGLAASLVNVFNPPAEMPPSLSTPNTYVGLGDHPLDKNAINLENIFDLFGLPPRKAACILRADLFERKGNSFIFSARGYDIYTNRRMEMNHRYVTDDEMPYTEMRLQLDFLREDLYRVRLAKGDSVPENVTPMIVGDLTNPHLEVTLEEHADFYMLRTPALGLKIHRRDFRVEVLNPSGGKVTEVGGRTKTLFSTVLDSFPTGLIDDEASGLHFAVENFTLAPGEAIYGFGERFSDLNKRGQTVGLWTVDGMGNTSGRTYKNIPFFMTTAGYGVFVNHVLPMTFFVGSRSYVHNLLAAEGDSLDYYFFYGPSLKKIVNTYTDLTGKSPVPPKWSFGLWVSRISYDSQDEVLETARRLRAEKIPADVINIDTNWFNGEWQCDWRFGPRFPDPETMFSEMSDQHLRACLWQWPYICEHLEIYKEAQAEGVLAEGGNFDMLLFKVRTIDMSKPKAVAWYQSQLRRLFKLGASVIKVDFGEHVRDYERYQNYSGREMHNLYPLLYNRAAFEVSKDYFGQGLIWARSAYAGSQRYPVHWSGDNSATFENPLCSLRGGLSLGLSGFTFWSNDVGGFTGTPSDKLYLRWTQFGLFNSHMRLHGTGPKYREPWNYDADTLEIFRCLIELRYRFLPYLYSEAHHSAQAGLPILRPLVYEFQDDPTTYPIEDQFLFGQAVLVAPLLTEQDQRKAYLPAGLWADGWTGDIHTGPRWIDVHADLDQVPFFYRGGYAVPHGPAMQYVDERSLDPLTLHIVPDETGGAAYTMVDDGETVTLSGQLSGDIFQMQIDSSPRELVVNLYSTTEIRSLECNGVKVALRRIGGHHFTGEHQL